MGSIKVQSRRTDSAEARALKEATELALLASVAFALLATLAPFQLALPTRFRFDLALALRWNDVALNLVLFAPFGFALAMRRPGQKLAASCAHAIALGAGLSALLELSRLFVPVRCPSPIDVLMNALGSGAGAYVYARAGQRAERALVRCLHGAPSGAATAALACALAWIALAPIAGRPMLDSFHWTLGTAPLVHGPRSAVIGLMASLGLSAWLGFALRLRSCSAWMASAHALPIVALIEICRGYSALHVASLSTLLLAAVCALVSAHAAGRVRLATARARRIWV